MKHFLRGLLSLIMILSMPVMASCERNSIFPEYTGLQIEVKDQSFYMRNYPSEYSDYIENIQGKKVYLLGQNQDWYRIRVDGKEGWVTKHAVTLKEPVFIPHSRVLGEEVVAYGKQFIGTPYVWGGNDLKKGIDCSGLTKEVYKGFNIDISRVSHDQVYDGIRVSKSELRPGDLVFFDTSGINTGRISHVGIYAGDGLFLHADCTRGVTLSRLSDTYYARNYVTGSRILNKA